MTYQWSICRYNIPNFIWISLLYFFIVFIKTSLCNIVSLNSNDIYNKKEPRYFTPFLGTSLSINCPLELFNNEIGHIKWLKDDKTIQNNGPIDIIDNKLTITFLEPEHTGTYRCYKETSDGVILSHIIYVYVKCKYYYS